MSFAFCFQFSPHMVWPANVCEMWIVFGELILCICFVRLFKSSIWKLYIRCTLTISSTLSFSHFPFPKPWIHVFCCCCCCFFFLLTLILFSSFSISFFDILIHKRNSISLSRFSVYRIYSKRSPHIHLRICIHMLNVQSIECGV